MSFTPPPPLPLPHRLSSTSPLPPSLPRRSPSPSPPLDEEILHPNAPSHLPPPRPHEVFPQALHSLPTTRSEPGPSDTPVASSGHGNAGSSVTVAAHPPLPTVEVQLTKGLLRKVSGTRYPIDLDPTMKNVTVTRAFMHQYFGAHPTHRYSEPPRDRCDYDHFIFLDGVRKTCSPLFLCPIIKMSTFIQRSMSHAPSAPGEPGLVTFFEERPLEDNIFYRLFVRTDAETSKWQYMGLYKATKLPAWTPEEMRRLPVAVCLTMAAFLKSWLSGLH